MKPPSCRENTSIERAHEIIVTILGSKNRDPSSVELENFSLYSCNWGLELSENLRIAFFRKEIELTIFHERLRDALFDLFQECETEGFFTEREIETLSFIIFIPFRKYISDRGTQRSIFLTFLTGFLKFHFFEIDEEGNYKFGVRNL